MPVPGGAVTGSAGRQRLEEGPGPHRALGRPQRVRTRRQREIRWPEGRITSHWALTSRVVIRHDLGIIRPGFTMGILSCI